MALINVTVEGALGSAIVDTEDAREVAAYILLRYCKEEEYTEAAEWLQLLINSSSEHGRKKAMDEF